MIKSFIWHQLNFSCFVTISHEEI
uniref:Uncharacterized protein n=1 Tax=Rhizophora mucronata TaxID=61149 RepID=A0A2P2IU24_RHIMU